MLFIVTTGLLKDILCKLSTEDHTLRTFRRAIGFGRNIKKDIVPLLIHAQDTDVIDETIRLLVNLTIPVECLLSIEVMSRTEIGRHTIYEVNNLLVTAKESFSDSHATKAIVDRIKTILETDSKLTVIECEKTNNCLLLLRNLLHVEGNNTGGTSVQNRIIIWNLFTQTLDKQILHLINCNQSEYWTVIVIQLIALLYKDQHVGTLQKLLNGWFEASLSESSEDDESNTSPPRQCSGGSSPMLTSDSSSDSSDAGEKRCSTKTSSAVHNEWPVLGGENCMSTSTAIENKQVSCIELQKSLIRAMPKQRSESTEMVIDESNDQHNMSSSGFGSIDERSICGSEKILKVITIALYVNYFNCC